MDFVDKTVVGLADEATRPNLFDQEALEQLLSAAYATAEMGAQGPFAPQFDDFRMAYAPSPLGSLEGTWNVAGAADRSEARFRVAGLPGNGMPRVDALWRGAIVARVRAAGEPIVEATATATDAETIESTVIFAEPQPVSAAPRSLPVAVALLVRPSLEPAELLHDAGAVRDRLQRLGVERPPDEELRLRRSLIVSLVVPEDAFDDEDWPGAAPGMTTAQQRAARRAAAGAWLAREGVGLVVVP